MIAGILKKVRQSGEVSYVSAQIVYANDKFKWTLGFDESVEHEPAALDQDPGEPLAAYAVAVLKDGSRLLEVMRKSEIEKVRNVSRSKGAGPWVQWWGEMARKTVMRRLSKRLPMSSDLDDAFQRDETMEPIAPPPAAEVIDIRPEAPVSKLDALEHQIASAGTFDAETGEIDEGPSDEQRGETHTTKDALADILTHLAKKVTVIDVNSLVSSRVGELDEEDRAALAEAQVARIAEIRGAA
jgi:recombination protein RecT